MCRSEDKRGKAAQEPTMKSNFETVVGRGVYTPGIWRKGFELFRSTAVLGSEAPD